MVNIFDITKCDVPPREKILPGLISDCSIPEMYFPAICSCPDFSISPPLDPPAIPCIVTPHEDFDGGVRPPPPPPPPACKLAQVCCPHGNDIKKLCYDPRKKPSWGKTIQKDATQYEPIDGECAEPCEDVLWLKEECPNPCIPTGGGDPCVDDPCGNPPGHSNFHPVIPPSTGTAVDDCCWWMWCPCNIQQSSLAGGNFGGGRAMFQPWPKPFTKSSKCPATASDISSDTSHPGHWVRITGQGSAAKCGSVNPPGILGRYWGDVAIVCFCKMTPGSGLSFMSVVPLLSLRFGSAISVRSFPHGSSLSIRGIINLGPGLSLRMVGRCISLTGHPIDNQYAKCCVCVKQVTGQGQHELNGTYCKKVITDTVYLREGNSQIRIEKKGGGWAFTVMGHIVARGLPLGAAHPADVFLGQWTDTPAANNVLGGVTFGLASVENDKCEGTDSGEYLFNTLSSEDRQYVQVQVGDAMWNRPIQAQTLIDSSSSGTWGSSIQLRSDGYYSNSHSATGTPHNTASMTLVSDSFNTGGGEWYVVASMYTAPTQYAYAETPHIVHPYATPFAVMNITAELASVTSSTHGQNVGLLLKQGDKYYGCKIGCAVDSNYSLFILRGLTEESFCELDIPPISAPTGSCSYSVAGEGYTRLLAGYSDYPQFYVDVDIDDHATTGAWTYDGGDQDANRFTRYGRPLMKADSHPTFKAAVYPIQLGIYVAHQVGLNMCILKPDTQIRNLTVTVGC